MDERCAKFASDAALRPTDPKLVATLRKFLFRNQEQRLSAAAQQALCDAAVRHAAAAATGAEVAAAVALVEDALAMPFNVFTTGHKKQLLKHLDRLRGLEAAAGGAAAGAGAGKTTTAPAAAAADGADADARECAVLEVTPEGAIEVMDDDGETATCAADQVSEEDAAAIREAFDRGEEEVRVRAAFVSSSSAAVAKKGARPGGGGGGDSSGTTARILGIVVHR